MTDAVRIADAEWKMQEHRNSPTDMRDSDKAKVNSAVRSLIPKYISTEIHGELTPEAFTNEPRAMLTSIAKLFAETSDEIHRLIESKAREIQLKEGHAIKDYITEHKNIRRCMNLAAYPGIDDEIPL